MTKSSVAILALILSLIGMTTMLAGLLHMLANDYEEIVYWGAAFILGVTQIIGALLLLLGVKHMKPSIKKAFYAYWVFALFIILFTVSAGFKDETLLTAGITMGLFLSLFHLYVNIGALNVHKKEEI